MKLQICVFLASKKSSYINGQNIRVDGFPTYSQKNNDHLKEIYS